MLTRVFCRRVAQTTQQMRTPISVHAQQALTRCEQKHTLTSRFVNVVMKSGDKRALMESQVAEGLHLLHRKTHQNPDLLFAKAIDMLAPVVETASFKRGAKLIRVPLPLTEYRSQAYAMRWMKKALDKKRRPPVLFPERFAAEVLAVLEGKSPLLERKAVMHREALANRSFSHFRWAVGYRM